MAFARDVYTASSSQTDFTISFPFLANVDVNVFKDGVLMTEQADADVVSYQIITSSIVRFGAGLTSGDIVVVQRKTSQSTRLVDYVTPSTLTEEDLDNDSLQAFYMAQESIDSATLALGLDTDDLWTAESKRIKDVDDPTAAQDAATKTYVDTVLAADGNVPVPAADKQILVASGATQGDFAWVTALDAVNQIADNLISGAKIAMGSDAAGDVIHYDGADYIRLAVGAAGDKLVVNSGATAPEWAQGFGLSVSSDTQDGTTKNKTTQVTLPTFIEIVFDKVGFSGSGVLGIRLGTSGSFDATGYLSTFGSDAAVINATTGFNLSIAAADQMSGVLRLTHATGDVWVADGSFFSSATAFSSGGGRINLSGTLNRVQVYTTGTALDQGSWSVRWHE